MDDALHAIFSRPGGHGAAGSSPVPAARPAAIAISSGQQPSAARRQLPDFRAEGVRTLANPSRLDNLVRWRSGLARSNSRFLLKMPNGDGADVRKASQLR
jgi:hypothetical protein